MIMLLLNIYILIFKLRQLDYAFTFCLLRAYLLLFISFAYSVSPVAVRAFQSLLMIPNSLKISLVNSILV